MPNSSGQVTNTTIAQSPKTAMPSTPKIGTNAQHYTQKASENPSVTTPTQSQQQNLPPVEIPIGMDMQIRFSDLQQRWKAFFEKEENPLLRSVGDCELLFDGKHHIKVMLLNTLQTDKMVEVKERLQHYLRQHLQHGQIQVFWEMLPATTTAQKRPYTDSEKLEYLCSKNNLADEIRKRLHLDLE